MSKTLNTNYGKGPEAISLYSDWKVSFVTSLASKDEKNEETDSVSTQSLSDDSVSSSDNVLNESLKDQGIFSIHRNMVGPKSNFFFKSFESEDVCRSTVITLPMGLPIHSFASIVEAFEVLLDYCYTGSIREDNLETGTAVALFCLCNYFEMESEMCDKVNDFIKSDLRYETVAKYYQIIKDLRCQGPSHDVVLNAEPIMKMVIEMCYQTPSTLDCESELFKISDLSLWLSIGSLLAQDGDENDKPTSADASKIWSENLTNFFDVHREESMKDCFRTLTDEKVLPEVSAKAALRLLEHEHKHGLAFLTRRAKKRKDTIATAGDNIFEASSNDTDDGTISTTCDSEIDVVLEEELFGTEQITNLQQRCIKALCESNWYGKENNVEQMRGKLIEITTHPVLEALLIDSVTGGRVLTSNMEKMRADVELEKEELAKQIDAYNFKKEETKVEVAKEKVKQHNLQQELDHVRKEYEALKIISKKNQEKSASIHDELCKANAILEADLDAEKKKSYNIDQKYREMKRAQNKIETDREMFELSVKDTIKRLDALTSYEEAGGCGLGGLIFLISAMSDRAECTQIKTMLQQVVKDPLTYERNYLLKNMSYEDHTVATLGDDSTLDKVIQIGNDDDSFL